MPTFRILPSAPSLSTFPHCQSPSSTYSGLSSKAPTTVHIIRPVSISRSLLLFPLDVGVGVRKKRLCGWNHDHDFCAFSFQSISLARRAAQVIRWLERNVACRLLISVLMTRGSSSQDWVTDSGFSIVVPFGYFPLSSHAESSN